MAVLRDPSFASWRGRVPPWVWHAIGLVLAALIAWAVWRGYQNPDFLFDLSAVKLC